MVAQPPAKDTNHAVRGIPAILWHSWSSGKVTCMKSRQRLSRQALNEFKAIHEQEFGEPLSDEAVHEMGLRVLRIFAIVCKPLPSDVTVETSSG
jgi:hypothetical protein